MGCSSKSKFTDTEREAEKDFFISKCDIFGKYDTRAITGRITKKSPDNELGIQISRGSCPEVFVGKGILKICSKFIREHPGVLL